MLAYWQHYHLNYDPFTEEESHADCYISSQWKQLLELIQNLSTHSRAVLLVTGREGVGKSTFLNQLVLQIKSFAGVCHIQSDEAVTPEVICHLLSRHLDMGLPQQDPELFSQYLKIQLQKMQNNNQHYVLVVDDAHLLPSSSLALLLTLMSQQPGDIPTLHIILFGTVQLDTLISEVMTQENSEVVTHTLRIHPMTKETTEAYLKYKVEKAGLDGPSIFSPTDINIIYESSEGLPLQVNQIAKQILEGKIMDDDKNTGSLKSSFFIKLGYTAVSVAVVIGILMWLFPSEPAKEPEIVLEIDEPVPMPKKDLVTSVDETIKSPIDKENKHYYVDDEQGTLEMNAIDNNIEAQGLQATADPERIAETSDVIDEEEGSEGTQNEQEDINVELEDNDDLLIMQGEDDYLITADPKHSSVGQNVNSENTVASQGTSSILSKQPDSKPLINENNQPTKTSQAQNKTALKNYYGQGNELMKFNSQHFTIQIMGAYSEKQLKSFINSVGIKNKLYYFQTYHQGRPWYVVVYNTYSSQEAAKRGILSLPKAVQKVKPWVRSLASVQQSIQKQSR